MTRLDSLIADLSQLNSPYIAGRFVGGVSVIRFETEDDAVALANDSELGLGAYVQTGSLERAHRLAARLQAGLRQHQWLLQHGTGGAVRRLQAERLRALRRAHGSARIPADQDGFHRARAGGRLVHDIIYT